MLFFLLILSMQIEEFLEVEALEAIRRREVDSPTIPVDRAARHAEFLLNLGDWVSGNQLERCFGHFDPRSVRPLLRARLLIQRATTKEALERHAQNAGASSKDQLERIQLKHAHHALEVAAIVAASGIADEEGPVHVHDVCAGVGRVSQGVGLVRPGKSTSITAWERSSTLRRPFEKSMMRLALDQSEFEFRSVEVNEADLGRRPGKSTYCMGKHSCGPSTAHVIQRIFKLSPEDRPLRTVLMTCCRGTARDVSPFHVGQREYLPPEVWFKLARMAVPPEPDDSVHCALSEVARRIVDVSQIAWLPEGVRAWVTELYPSGDKPVENHGIIIENCSS